MYPRSGRARVVSLMVGSTALAAVILVSHVVPSLAPILLPAGAVGLVLAVGLGLASARTCPECSRRSAMRFTGVVVDGRDRGDVVHGRMFAREYRCSRCGYTEWRED